jgi:hypothetical protein
MKNARKTLILLIIFIISGTGALIQAQMMQQQQEVDTNVSDDELKNFASALQKVQIVQKASQEKMIKALEDEDITVERYNEIYTAQQDPEQEVKANKEEMANFNSASEKIEEIQTKTNTKIQKEIKEDGLTVKRYQEIMTVMQQDQELQMKLQQYLAE